MHTTFSSDLHDAPPGWSGVANSRTSMTRLITLACEIDAPTVMGYIRLYGIEAVEVSSICRSIIDKDLGNARFGYRGRDDITNPGRCIQQRRRGFQVQIFIKGCRLYLGEYRTWDDAIRIRDAANEYIATRGDNVFLNLYKCRPNSGQRRYWSESLGVDVTDGKI